MSWRDQLQPGSFRGIEFHVAASQGTLGRRVQVHEYPHQNQPWVEDLGRKTREYSLDVFVIGSDYHTRRDALINAVEQVGAGTLIHPRRGAMRVVMTDNCRWSESTREGGIAKFTLAFVQAGERQFPIAQSDSVSAVQSTANSGLTALQTDVNKRFKITGWPQFLSDDALASIRNRLNTVRKVVSVVDAAQRGDVLNLIDALDVQLPNLLTDTWQLVGEIIRVQRSVFTLFITKDSSVTPNTTANNADKLNTAIALRHKLVNNVAEPPVIPATTPSRTQQTQNRTAMQGLFAISATILAVQTVAESSPAIRINSNSDSPFHSYNHAVAVRDQLMAELDAIATTADNDLYIAVSQLQTELHRHIAAHGYQLERITYHSPAVELPSLVIAHNLYGDAARAADIVRRNNLRHPGFVPAGPSLEVLNA